MPNPEFPKDRTMDMTVPFLKKHVEGKLWVLPQLATHFGLNEEVVKQMKERLEDELKVLNHFPENLTLADLVNNYFSNAQKFKEPIIESRESGYKCPGCSYCARSEPNKSP